MAGKVLTTSAIWDDDLLLPSAKIPTPILRPSSPHDFDHLLNVTPEKGNRLSQAVGKGKKKGHVYFSLEGDKPKHKSGKDIFADIKNPNAEKSLGKKSKRISQEINSNKYKSTCTSKKKISELRKTRPNDEDRESLQIQNNCKIKPYVTRLERPKLHSTGALEQRIQDIELEDFDVGSAVASTLKESERVRHEFVERVAEAVNVPKGCKKYSGLVSVDVPVAISAVEERIPKPRKSKQKCSLKAQTCQPDIMECFQPSMLTDVADLSASRIPHYEVRPSVVPVDSAFDIYRHIQQWQT